MKNEYQFQHGAQPGNQPENKTKQPELKPIETNQPQPAKPEQHPSESPEKIFQDMSDMVEGAEAQKPIWEQDKRSLPAGLTPETLGPKSTKSIKPLGEISIPEMEGHFQRQFEKDEGDATKNAINAINHFREAA